MIHIHMWQFVLIVITCMSTGAMLVALFAWSRTYRAAVQLLTMLDILTEHDRDLQAQLAEMKPDNHEDDDRFDR